MSEETKQPEDLNFNLVEETTPVSVQGRGIKPYSGVLREASEEAATKFHSANISARRMSDDGKVLSIDGKKLADVRAQLVSDCLDPSPGVAVVKTWPHRIINKIFERAKEISSLNDIPGDRDALQKMQKKIAEQLARLDHPNGSSEATEDTSEQPQASV